MACCDTDTKYKADIIAMYSAQTAMTARKAIMCMSGCRGMCAPAQFHITISDTRFQITDITVNKVTAGCRIDFSLT